MKTKSNKKIVKVCVFDKDTPKEIVIKGNGNAILDNIILSAVTEENLITGEYYFDLISLIDDDKLYKLIEEEAILKVHMDYGQEIFKVAKVSTNSRELKAFARQITISEMIDMWLEDVRPTNINGQGVLTTLIDNSIGKKEVRAFSDISILSTAYYQDMNLYKALFDTDQSFINRWGGEIQRRGYDLTINKKIGRNRGIQIRSNKNLTGFNSDTNIDKVVTRIKPKGFEGITINGYIDSPIINNYSTIKTKEIKYEDVKVKKTSEDKEGFNTLEEAQAELIRRAKLEFSENHIDKIRAYYRINFVQLEYTEEYKNYIQAERVYLGDEVDIYEDKLGVNLKARVIRKKFDVMKQKVIETELSNGVKQERPPTIGDVIDSIDKIEGNIDESNKWFEDSINDITDQIQNGIKDSYVIYRRNEVLIMDTKDINTATNVWRWNRGGLGHSSTGYYGDYSTAITQDGSIVATMITSGVLNAYLLKTGVIKSHGGEFEINLDAGTIKANEGQFKVVIDGKEDDITTKSMLEATESKFNFKFQNSGRSNELFNSDFSKGSRGWITNTSDKIYFEVNTSYGGDVPTNCGIRIDDCTGIERYAYQTYRPSNPRATKNKVSAWVHLADCIDSTNGTSGYPMTHLYASVRYEDDTYSWHNLDCRDLANNINNMWVKVEGNMDTPYAKTSAIKEFWFYVYKRNRAGVFRVTQIMVNEGNIALPWRPSSSEIYSNVTTIDREGVSVQHSSGAKSILNHEKVEFTSSNNRKTLRIKDGGLNFFDPSFSLNEMVGFIKPSVMKQHGENINGVTVSTYNDGEYIAIGTSYSTDDTSWTSNPAILICSREFGTNYLGLNILEKMYMQSESFFRNWIYLKAGTPMNFNHDIPNRPPSQIWGSLNDLYLNVFGNDGIKFGIKYGLDNHIGTKIYEEPTSSAKVSHQHWGNHDYNGWALYNANVSRSLKAQSQQFKKIRKSYRDDVEVPYTLNKGQLRYTCTESQHVTNYELMVEIPQIIAENITSKYHVSISKLSFGDYRIKEKTPYYFIIESNMEIFSFTYEIIGTKIEKPDPVSIIASKDYYTMDDTIKSENKDYSFIDLAEEKKQPYWNLYRKENITL